jgi:hypothetical protein
MMKDLAAASPPVAMASMSLLGFPVTDWAALVSILWVFALAILKFREIRDKKNKCTCKNNGTS